MMHKKWLIIAASLIVAGIVIFAGVMTMLNWDFSKLSTSKFETNSHNITEPFTGISIHTDTADIEFIPSADGNCVVTCYESENEKHSVAVKDGVLDIQLVDEKKWYQYIGFNFSAPKITVSLPVDEYESLTIDASTGDVNIEDSFRFETADISLSTGDISVKNISGNSMYLTVSTGKISAETISCTGDLQAKVSTGKTTLTDITCSNLTASGSTGKIKLEQVTVSEKCSITRSTGNVELINSTAGTFHIKTSTGNVEFEQSDANELNIETSTGDVEGTLLSEKVFITDTDTGDIDVPESITGGKCKITTSTGDISIRFVN